MARADMHSLHSVLQDSIPPFSTSDEYQRVSRARVVSQGYVTRVKNASKLDTLLRLVLNASGFRLLEPQDSNCSSDLTRHPSPALLRLYGDICRTWFRYCLSQRSGQLDEARWLLVLICPVSRCLQQRAFQINVHSSLIRLPHLHRLHVGASCKVLISSCTITHGSFYTKTVSGSY
jgi:hypothetical protein